jgi:hypothetical protein
VDLLTLARLDSGVAPATYSIWAGKVQRLVGHGNGAVAEGVPVWYKDTHEDESGLFSPQRGVGVGGKRSKSRCRNIRSHYLELYRK